MKKIKLLLALLLTSGLFTACSDDVNYTPGPDEDPNCYGVCIPAQKNEGDIELDPAVSTVFTLTATRTNVNDTITVPVEIIENTDGAFTMEPIVFQDGVGTAQFNVTLDPNSELNKPYSFEFAVTDSKYASLYVENSKTNLNLTITRVKWIDLGNCDYTEDIIFGWYNFNGDQFVPGYTYPVKVQVREDSIDDLAAFNNARAGKGTDEDLAGIYRLVDVYQTAPFDEDATKTYYIPLVCKPYNKCYIPDLTDLGTPAGIDHPCIWSYVGYYMANNKDESSYAQYYGQIKNGKVIFPEKALIGHRDSEDAAAGSLYYANTNSKFAVNLAPALNKYEIVLPDCETGDLGDFNFEDVELPANTKFWSQSQVAAWAQNLQKGVATTNQDNCADEFAEKYGTIYRLPDLYAQYYDVMFLVDGKNNVALLPGWEDIPLGITGLGNKLDMLISADDSKFNADNTLKLSVEIISENGKLSYGMFEEVLSPEMPDWQFDVNVDLTRDFTYTTLYSDTFTSPFRGDAWVTELQQGTARNEDGQALNGTAYCLPDLYAAGYNIYFAADSEGKVMVPQSLFFQPIGINEFGIEVYATITGGTVDKGGVSLKVNFNNGKLDDKNNVEKSLLATVEVLEHINWVDVTTGTYTVGLFTNMVTSNCTLQQGEGTSKYRILGFTGKKDVDCIFNWNTTTNKCELAGAQSYGWSAGQGIVWAYDGKGYYNDYAGNNYSWAVLEANGFTQPYYDPATLTFNFHVKPGIPGVDFYDWTDDTFVLDSAPVVQSWEKIATGTWNWAITVYNGDDQTEPGLDVSRFGTTQKYMVSGLLGDWDLEMVRTATDIDIVNPYLFSSSQGIYIGTAKNFADALGATLDAVVDFINANLDATYVANSYDAATKTFTIYTLLYSASGSVYYLDENDPYFAPNKLVLDGNVDLSKLSFRSNLGTKKTSLKLAATFNGPKKNIVAKGSVKDENIKCKGPQTNNSLKDVKPTERKVEVNKITDKKKANL